jgi:hypothetical protein
VNQLFTCNGLEKKIESCSAIVMLAALTAA